MHWCAAGIEARGLWMLQTKIQIYQGQASSYLLPIREWLCKRTWPSEMGLEKEGVMVHLHGQLDGNQDHRGNKPPQMYVRDYLN